MAATDTLPRAGNTSGQRQQAGKGRGLVASTHASAPHWQQTTGNCSYLRSSGATYGRVVVMGRFPALKCRTCLPPVYGPKGPCRIAWWPNLPGHQKRVPASILGSGQIKTCNSQILERLIMEKPICEKSVLKSCYLNLFNPSTRSKKTILSSILARSKATERDGSILSALTAIV